MMLFFYFRKESGGLSMDVVKSRAIFTGSGNRISGSLRYYYTFLKLILYPSVLLSIVVYTLFQFSPWPSALWLRLQWDRSGVEMNNSLRKHLPAGVVDRLNLQYDTNDDAARLDVFTPLSVKATDRVLPTIVWVHGGSWISGSKDQIANYLRILAARGFAVVGVDYTLAPARIYPNPVRQVNAALGFLNRNGLSLHVDRSQLFLAGDSAGAQIAAQVANIISSPSYAADVGIVPSVDRSQLKGVVLHCGTYEAKLARFRKKGVLWAYFGTQDFSSDPRLSQFSVARHVTSEFPPMFISVGNDDELAPQSYLFADNVAAQGVLVDRLFFSKDYTPKVWHQFQFDLDTRAGRLALEHSVDFISARLR
jgi:acetyl esterase